MAIWNFQIKISQKGLVRKFWKFLKLIFIQLSITFVFFLCLANFSFYMYTSRQMWILSYDTSQNCTLRSLPGILYTLCYYIFYICLIWAFACLKLKFFADYLKITLHPTPPLLFLSAQPSPPPVTIKKQKNIKGYSKINLPPTHFHWNFHLLPTSSSSYNPKIIKKNCSTLLKNHPSPNPSTILIRITNS